MSDPTQRLTPQLRRAMEEDIARMERDLPGPVTAPSPAALRDYSRGPTLGTRRDLPRFQLDGPQPEIPSQQGARLSAEDGPVAPTLPEDTDQRPEDTDEAGPREKARMLRWTPLTEEYYYVPDATAYPNPYYMELYLDYGEGTAPPDDGIRLQYIHHLEAAAPNAVERTRGMDGSVYAEHEGFIQKMFSLQGRSGAGKLDLIRFQKMRNFFQKYASESTKHKNALVRGKDVRLAIHFPFEGESHFCDILSFDYTRSTESSTTSFEFRVVIVTNGLMGRRWALPKASDALLKSASAYDLNHLGAKHPCLLQAKRELPALPPWINETPLRPAYEVLAAVEEGSDPCEFAWLARLGITNIHAYASTLMHAQRLAVLSSTFYLRMFLADMADSALVMLGSKFIECPTSAVLLPVFRRSMVGPAPLATQRRVVPHIVRAGRNNAYDIAEDVYGDRGRAPAIVRANRMQDAYTGEDGAPLVPGDTVVVPSSDAPFSVEGDVFGVDLLLGKDGDLVATGTDDIATVGGYDCYTQNISHRLTTIRGENKTFPTYGLPRYVGTAVTSDVPGDLRANIRTQLMADHRTERITSLELEELGDKVRVDLTVQPIGLTPAKLEFTYDLVT